MPDKLLIIFLLITITTACRTPSAVPTPTHTPTPMEASVIYDAFAINRKLGRGINLGNALEGPAEGDWGVVLQEEYFELIAERGFDSVRIPIRWSTHADENEPYMIDPNFIQRVDWAVDNSLRRDLAVVINFHHYEEIFIDPDGHEKRFLAMWTQVAEHYQDAAPELVFEILNEPHDALTTVRWNDLLIKALAVIRESNPNRVVLIGPGEWNSIKELKNLELPMDDPNIIVTFHYYLPFDFTHQGAEWVDGSEAWLGKIWDATPGQQSILQADLNTAAQWGMNNNRPIYLGEFGAYHKANLESRVQWTKFVARTSESFGFSWGYWEFCAGFGIYNRDTKSWNEPLVQSLIPDQ